MYYSNQQQLDQYSSLKPKTMKSETKTDTAYRILGKTQFQEGDLEAASQSYRQAIELNPKQPAWVYQHLATIFSQEKQLEEAIKLHKQAIQLQPENSSFYRSLAKLQAQKGDIEKAIPNYRKAIELEPDQPSWVYQHLASALSEQDQPEESIAVYQKGIELEPENSVTYRGIAKSQFQQGDIEGAIVSYCKAIELDSDQPSWVYNNLADIFQKQGKLDEAAKIYYQLGQSLAKQKKWSETIVCYRKVIEIKPDFHETYLYLGDIFRYQEDLDQAISYYLKAIQINSEFRDPYARLVTILQKADLSQEQLDKICKITQQIVANNYDHNLLYQSLSDALSLQGNIREAMAYNQKLTRKNNSASNSEFINKHWGISNLNMPNFLIIGFAKCGTTSLYDYMIKHPRILEAGRKEINFFNNEKLFKLGIDWYKSNFPSIPNETGYITGEATPTYILNSVGMERIRNLCPNIKLIVILRNPVDRAISQHHFSIKRGGQYRSLEPAIISGITKIQNITNLREKIEQHYGYIPNAGILSASLYIYFLEKLMKFFSREQLLILKTEDLSEKPNETMNELFNFLGLSSYQISKFPRKNTGSYTPEISDEVRQKLSNFFRPYNQRLEDFLGIKLNWK